MNSKIGPSIVTDLLARERDKSVSKPTGPIKKKDDPVDDLVRMAAAGIGFASEAIHHRKQKKAAAAAAEAAASDLESSKTVTDESKAEASSEASASSESPPKKPKNKDHATQFITRHPFHPTTTTPQNIPLPVVLVQRRPKTRARGFIRAYAPSLAAAGVEQAAFVDFIDTLNTVLEPDPWLHAINLADLATMAAPIPEPFSMLLGFAIGAAAEGTMEAQSRFRSNRFLDRVNAEYFAPRGLICFPATWRPQAKDGLITTVGFEGQAEASESAEGLSRTLKGAVERKVASLGESQGLEARLQRQMNAHGGYLHWDEPAPLVFVPQAVPDKKPNAFDRGCNWLDDHVDKHSQALFIEKNQDVPMAAALPQPTFQSRYADPNHPAASGDLVAFLTGGAWQGRPEEKPVSGDEGHKSEKERLKAEKKQKREQEKRDKEEAKLEKKEQKKREKKDKKMEKNAGKTGLSSLFQMVCFPLLPV